MTLRKLVYYPNECLKTTTQPVTDFTKELQKLIDDMFETMYAENGVGLAAPQIGISKSLAVINVDENKKNPVCLINPVILEKKGQEVMAEGCLSVPGVYEKVTRAQWVKIRALDRKGKPFELEGKGLLAECLQHEIDHLYGVLYIDQLSSVKRQRLIERMKKFCRKYKNKL